MKKISLEEYQRIGKKMKRIKNTMSDIFKVLKFYPKHKWFKKFLRMRREINNFCSSLDDQVCKDYPDKSDKELTNIFYGYE
jgi:hypothetical protein